MCIHGRGGDCDALFCGFLEIAHRGQDQIQFLIKHSECCQYCDVMLVKIEAEEASYSL
jgi:hypothetical protein